MLPNILAIIKVMATLLLFTFFFVFVHVSLFMPGYVIAMQIPFLRLKPELRLVVGYVFSIVFFALIALVWYMTSLPVYFISLCGWIALIGSGVVFVQQKLYKDFRQYGFPLLCLVLASALSCAFLTMRFDAPYTYVPDPKPVAVHNYNVANVKVLNIVKTQANDNYVPYRQAQFIVNRSNLGTDCFICSWGVHFFQRTPLLGAVTAGYFTVLTDAPPVHYLWADTTGDPDHTYEKFQIIANVLNALFLLSAWFLLRRMFNPKVAAITNLFLISSPFFLYNAVFSWPKSLVAFFVLTMFLLSYEKQLRYIILAGAIGGLAYLTHDLAVFYIAALVLLLCFKKRFRDAVVLVGVASIFILPWMFISSVVYDKPSTFALYPLSTQGLPPPGKEKEIIATFLKTPIQEIISIRFDTLFYLLTPYDLIYSGGGQSWFRRLWAVGLFSIPGSLGLGLIIPAIIAVFLRIKKMDYWILVTVPILCATAIVGWRGSRAIASLHFAQAIIVLLAGLAVALLVRLRKPYWVLFAFMLQCIHLLFTIFYSYELRKVSWIFEPRNALILSAIAGLMIFSAYTIYNIMGKRHFWMSRWLK